MALGRQMHHRIGGMAGEDPVERGAVADIGMFEGILRVIGDAGHIVETGGIGQRVKIDHRMAGGNRLPHHRRSDEAGAAGDQQLHAGRSAKLSRSASQPAAASRAESTGARPSSPQSIPSSGSSQRTPRSWAGA